MRWKNRVLFDWIGEVIAEQNPSILQNKTLIVVKRRIHFERMLTLTLHARLRKYQAFPRHSSPDLLQLSVSLWGSSLSHAIVQSQLLFSCVVCYFTLPILVVVFAYSQPHWQSVKVFECIYWSSNWKPRSRCRDRRADCSPLVYGPVAL